MIKTISLAAAREYIAQMDLDYIVQKMCDSHYPLPRWTLDDANHCAQLYKNFLYLQKKHMPEALVPTREIDEFWHNHILFTQRYIQDCNHIFGHYLHHHPENPTDNPEKLIAAYTQTKAFYLEEFNEPLSILNIVR